MLINQFLFRKKLMGWINIIGLSLGMAAVIFILVWVENELTYDNYHTNANQSKYHLLRLYTFSRVPNRHFNRMETYGNGRNQQCDSTSIQKNRPGERYP